MLNKLSPHSPPNRGLEKQNNEKQQGAVNMHEEIFKMST